MIPNTSELLDFLEQNANLPFEPSLDVVAFLNRIDSADPNSPDLSEDNTDTGWGHCQFTAGNMQCTTVLLSWDKIGVPMARKLIAAAIKTC